MDRLAGMRKFNAVFARCKEWVGSVIPPFLLLLLLRPRNFAGDMVRLGPEADGGYLVPNDLDGLQGIFSPGVDNTADFERYFATRGVPCFLIDGSVDGPPFSHPKLDFEKKWLGSQTTSDAICLSDWLDQKAPEASELLLQMDIENAEYEVLRQADTQTLSRFRIMVIEFHLLSNKIVKKHQRYGLWKILWKIRKTHVPVHFHSNNCCGSTRIGRWSIPQVAEVSFIRIDRGKHLKTFAKLPSKHDRNNTPKPYLPTPWD